jgi:hypothetical protein
MHKTARWLAALAVGLAACASSSSPHALVIGVTELRQNGRPRQIAGDHYYRIRVTNRSTEEIVIDRIHIEPAGMTELDVEDATQAFNEAVGPDQTLPFDMPIRVLQDRASNAARGFSGYIDSLRVMIEAHNEKGSFSDSGDYGVGVEQPGGGGGESRLRVRPSKR